MSSYLKLLQDFVRFRAVFTKVLNFLALGAAAIVFNFGALWVYLGTLRLVAHGPVPGAHARTVRVSGEEPLPEFVHKAAVVHTSFPSIVIEDDVVVCGPLRVVGGIILWVDRGGRAGVHSKQHDAEDCREGAHTSPRYLLYGASTRAYGCHSRPLLSAVAS